MSSKKIVDPNEQEGESILLSELHDEVFEPAHDLNHRKGRLPLHGRHDWIPHHPGNGRCQ